MPDHVPLQMFPGSGNELVLIVCLHNSSIKEEINGLILFLPLRFQREMHRNLILFGMIGKKLAVIAVFRTIRMLHFDGHVS